jgi:tellurite methyltransferase
MNWSNAVTATNDSEYWDNFYASWVEPVPSQFAALIAGLYNRSDTEIFDFGCGNGRDTTFFHNYGFKVLSSDRSLVAVEGLKEKFSNSEHSPKFAQVDYGKTNQLASYLLQLKSREAKSLFYGRFLLHAMDEETLQSFLSVLIDSARAGDIFAFEFRTRTDDRLSGKATPDHFRRGIDTHEVLRHFDKDRHKVVISVEGFGFAIYKSDNAHVARVVIEAIN